MKRVMLADLNVKSFITGSFSNAELEHIQGGNTKLPIKTHLNNNDDGEG